MTGLTPLITRLEKATSADREIDAEICAPYRDAASRLRAVLEGTKP